jgi:hypothetical protein
MDPTDRRQNMTVAVTYIIHRLQNYIAEIQNHRKRKVTVKKFNVNLALNQWRTEGVGVWGVQTPPKFLVLTKLSRIPISMENTSVTT